MIKRTEQSQTRSPDRKGGVSPFNAIIRQRPPSHLWRLARPARISAKLLMLVALAFLSATPAQAGEWTEPAVVRRDLRPLVTYRAKLDGGYLVVRANHEEGWHTCAMDNKVRAEAKLAGRRSLGIDAPTEIDISGGLELAGGWRQSPPEDFSKPELRWFTWGFEEAALFVAKVRRTGPGPARISVRGQACSETSCQNIDLALSIPLGSWESGSPPAGIDFEELIAVLEANGPSGSQGDN